MPSQTGTEQRELQPNRQNRLLVKVVQNVPNDHLSPLSTEVTCQRGTQWRTFVEGAIIELHRFQHIELLKGKQIHHWNEELTQGIKKGVPGKNYNFCLYLINSCYRLKYRTTVQLLKNIIEPDNAPSRGLSPRGRGRFWVLIHRRPNPSQEELMSSFSYSNTFWVHHSSDDHTTQIHWLKQHASWVVSGIALWISVATIECLINLDT